VVSSQPSESRALMCTVARNMGHTYEETKRLLTNPEGAAPPVEESAKTLGVYVLSQSKANDVEARPRTWRVRVVRLFHRRPRHAGHGEPADGYRMTMRLLGSLAEFGESKTAKRLPSNRTSASYVATMINTAIPTDEIAAKDGPLRLTMVPLCRQSDRSSPSGPSSPMAFPMRRQLASCWQ
jgi:hypothetical protein